MSILIKGMKTPKSCSTCQMLEGDPADGICHAAGRWLDDDEYWTWYVYPEGDIDDSKPSNCPLIELPDHGDLIDRDEFEVKHINGRWYDAYVSHKAVLSSPVIIPAERSEDA